MFGALQVANYMGFDTIYLVGCDLGFGIHDPHMIFNTDIDPLHYNSVRPFLYDSYNKNMLVKNLINGLVFKLYFTPFGDLFSQIMDHVAEPSDPNHFSHNYRKKPKDNRHANDEIKKSHKVAKKILDDLGVNVYNATIGGELEIYERVDIESIV
jgi:hypothetical protein